MRLSTAAGLFVPLLALDLALALVVAGCTRNEAKPAAHDAAPTGTLAALADASVAVPTHPIARPRDAVAELGVLSDRARPELDALVTPASLTALLDTRHCGPVATCAAVRNLVATEGRVEVSLTTTTEWGLPAESALGLIAKGLTPKECAGLARLPTVVVVRVTGAATPEHLVARTAFALTAAIAEKLRGFVYDETVRRIETADEFQRHAITSALGDAAFKDDRILIQSYVQDDGTTRLISLGMRRFGAPDLEVRGAQPGAGRALAAVMNAVAERLAAAADAAPLVVALDDPRAKGKSAAVDLVVPPMQQGDPDNTVVRIVPAGGATVAGYDALVATFFGDAEKLVERADDAELAAATQRARRAFPAMAARWKQQPAPRPRLLVKLPFPMAGDAGVEWMWVDVTSVQNTTITGTLANSPAYATDLHAGSVVKGSTRDLYDAMLVLADGGTEGGETSKLLEGRK